MVEDSDVGTLMILPELEGSRGNRPQVEFTLAGGVDTTDRNLTTGWGWGKEWGGGRRGVRGKGACDAGRG